MSRMVSKRLLEDIRARNDIADVIGSYFSLRRMGTNLKALCPFHKEKTPSFVVNTNRQSYHCFGCGVGGDVFHFIQQKEGVDFPTAVEMMAERAGITLEFEQGDAPRGPDKKALYTTLHDLSLFYQRCLKTMEAATAARDYLKSRALDEATIDAFRIGYAPARWDAMRQWATRHQVSTEILEAAGMIIRSERAEPGREFYDRFRDRIMFPICDELGRVVGFSGRVMGGDTQGAKYVNSPETPVFRKSRILYALDKARKDMVDLRRAIVCEGQIDVIRCHAGGFTTAVASQGTAFTEEHASILKRYTDEVVIVFDSDTAGQTAAVKAARIFMQAGMSVRIAQLPAGEDPDSVILKQGADAFRRVLDSNLSVVEFQIGVLATRENTQSEVGVMRVAKSVLETVNACTNAVQRAALIQEAATRLALPTSALEEELRRTARRESRPASETETTPPPRPNEEIPADEKAACELLLQAPEELALLELATGYLPTRILTHPDAAAIFDAAVEASRSGSGIYDIIRERHPDKQEGLIPVIATLLESPRKLRSTDMSPALVMQDVILRLWKRHLTRLRQEVYQRRELGDEARRKEAAQLTLDINGLDRWDGGRTIIELAMEG